ncbi:MAG: DUF1684 domain-containing protein [Bacteroidota bacterium]|nr:DUF1684 domain-containing protein [Bacteroidota bacterium]
MCCSIALLLLSCSSFNKQIAEHRVKYKDDFLHDERSPLKAKDLINLDFYPPDKDARVKANFHLTPKAEPFDLPTYSGITKSYRKYGTATFLWNGDSTSLALYQNVTLMTNPVYKDYLFLPFKDETNGVETYGGGRYLDFSKEETSDGHLTIDFNKAYNPWCAYSSGYNCPIPPKDNQLSFIIRAGERQYKGETKH